MVTSRRPRRGVAASINFAAPLRVERGLGSVAAPRQSTSTSSSAAILGAHGVAASRAELRVTRVVWGVADMLSQKNQRGGAELKI